MTKKNIASVRTEKFEFFHLRFQSEQGIRQGCRNLLQIFVSKMFVKCL